METLRLINYKCFEDTDTFSFKPINLLVGSNSSGKSSFLEFLALIKQSLGVRKNGALLWSSEDGVDFQDFRNTVRNGNGDITFTFKIKASKFLLRRVPEDIVFADITLTIAQEDNKADYIKSIRIDCGDHIEISFTNTLVSYIKINGESINPTKHSQYAEQGKEIIPNIDFIDFETSCKAYEEESKYEKELWEKIGVTSDKDLLLPFRLSSFPLNKKVQRKRLINKIGDIDDKLFEELHNYIIYSNINTIIDRINEYLRNFTDNLIYIKPLRAESKRTYPNSNIAIDSVSPDGKNVPSYLLNLKQTNLLNLFNKWLSDFYNFKVDIALTMSLVQVLIEEEGKPKRNIADVGCGYSQILPVILSVWDSIFIDRDDDTSRRIRRYPRFVVIEQPELHLHPRMQGQFASMIYKTTEIARTNGIDLRFLIETHSEVIVNKIGLLVAEDANLSVDDVSVILFNAKEEGMEQNVSYSSFDKDGYLNNWPYGFFDDIC